MSSFPDHPAVHRAGRDLPSAHRLDHGGRTGDNVSSGVDPRHCGLAGLPVGFDIAPPVQIQLRKRTWEQRVRAGADGHYHQVADDLEIRALDRYGPSPPALVWLSQLHMNAVHTAGPTAVSPYLSRKGQETELHAFLHGMYRLLRPSWHLFAWPPIDEEYLLGAQAKGCAGAVQRHVASTYHCYAAAQLYRGIVIRKEVGLHQVRPGQVLVRRVDPVEVFPWDTHEDRQPRADAYERAGIAVFKQVLHPDCPSDHLVVFQAHAEGGDVINLPAYDRFRQPELGDAVRQHATRGVQSLEEGDLVAKPGQVPGAAQAGRACPDDRRLHPRRARFLRRASHAAVRLVVRR